jgi:hypothetical protein
MPKTESTSNVEITYSYAEKHNRNPLGTQDDKMVLTGAYSWIIPRTTLHLVNAWPVEL